jgi:hypothetical protein
MAPGAMIHITVFIKTGSGIQNLIGAEYIYIYIYRHTDSKVIS